MSKLTDRISYLQGLAAGMKLNPEKDSHRVILGILEVLGEVGTAFDALAESHGELSDYVEAIDEDLSDLEANLYDDDDEKAAVDEDTEPAIEYECPHCGATVEIDPDEVDFDEESLCPECGKELFPELPEEGLDGEAGETEASDDSDESEVSEKDGKKEKKDKKDKNRK